jgi:hypothetical protein
MSDPGYPHLDEALVPFHRHVQLLMPEGAPEGLRLTELVISMPVELDVLVEPGGGVSIGTSPPLYSVATGFRSVFHQVRLTIVEDERPSSGDE